MTQFTFDSHSLEETDRLGRLLAEAMPPGTVVALSGTLGAGKTRLVQAIAAACGVNREEVVSPTFVICHEYSGSRPIYHLDVYRLQSDEEFLKLGPQEYFDGDGITLIEWGDKVAACLPDERLEIHIEVTGESSRRFHLRPRGQLIMAAIEHLWSGTPARRYL